ncbi:MAG: hypothetical protein HZA68_20480 [Rhodovulum sp.]|nr:hypothetical protein [Rhodovulum sp.]
MRRPIRHPPAGVRPSHLPTRAERAFRAAWDEEIAKGENASMIRLAKLIGNLPEDWPDDPGQPLKE